MTHTARDWKDGPAGGTPLSAAALEDLENRLGAYTDEQVSLSPPAASEVTQVELDDAKAALQAEAAVATGVYSLDDPAARAATVINVFPAPTNVAEGTLVIIGKGAPGALIRKATDITGGTITLDRALSHAFTADSMFDTEVAFFGDGIVPYTWFGLVGNTDGLDEWPALQAFHNECGENGLVVSGQERYYQVTQPIVVAPSAKLSPRGNALKYRLHDDFAPNDLIGGAFLQRQETLVRAFTNVGSTFTARDRATDGRTGAASSNEVTCGMIFQAPGGLGLPTGIVSGRVYWAFSFDHTPASPTYGDFQIAATRAEALAGTGAITPGSNGAGDLQSEVPTLHKLFAGWLEIDGNDVAGTNGAFLNLQQPSFIDVIRTDNFASGWHLRLGGQQAVIGSIQCTDGGHPTQGQLVFDSMTMFTIRSINTEQATGACMTHTATVAESWYGTGGASCNDITGQWHVESGNGATGFDVEGPCTSLKVCTMSFTPSGAGQSLIHLRTGSVSNRGMTIENIRCVSNSGTPNVIVDDDGGHTLSVETFFRRHVRRIVVPHVPTSGVNIASDVVLYPAGGMEGSGSSHASGVYRFIREGTTHTGDLLRMEVADGAGNGTRIAGFGRGGGLFLALNAAPTSSWLANGEVRPWWDSTLGRIKWRGKLGDGTVVDVDHAAAIAANTAAIAALDTATDTRLDVLEAAVGVIAVNTFTADHTLALTDLACLVRFNMAGAGVLTVPPNASVAFPVGAMIPLSRAGAGSMTITPGSGVTIPNKVQVAGTSSRTIASQLGGATLHKVATNVWELVGDLA